MEEESKPRVDNPQQDSVSNQSIITLPDPFAFNDPFANIFATPDADNRNSEFWNYCGINIPTSIYSVPARDRANRVRISGSITEAFTTLPPYTIKEYQEIYSVVGTDNKLYWKE